MIRIRPGARYSIPLHATTSSATTLRSRDLQSRELSVGTGPGTVRTLAALSGSRIAAPQGFDGDDPFGGWGRRRRLVERRAWAMRFSFEETIAWGEHLTPGTCLRGARSAEVWLRD